MRGPSGELLRFSLEEFLLERVCVLAPSPFALLFLPLALSSPGLLAWPVLLLSAVILSSSLVGFALSSSLRRGEVVTSVVVLVVVGVIPPVVIRGMLREGADVARFVVQPAS